MLDFILAAQNVPFAVALALMLLIAAFEGVGMLLGAGLSDMLDSLIPDFQAQVDVDMADVGSANALSRLLGWLKLGRVPTLILLVVFLTAFGLLGYVIQFTSVEATGFLLPAILAVVPAFFGALPVVRLTAGVLEHVLPRDETSAVSTDSFVGRIATVTLGTARHERPAEARLTDRHRTTHYVHVVPEKGQPPIAQGSKVLLVRKEGAHFVGIENEDTLLDG